MEGYGYLAGGQYNESRRHEYKRFIHDLSKKLSHENVQSIAFLKHTSTDCYDYPACARMPPHGGTHGGPTNHGLHVLEHLWHSGLFSEGNLKPLENLLRDIGRHDLADECHEMSGKLGYCEQLPYSHRFAEFGGGPTGRAPPMPIPVPMPPTLLTSPAEMDGKSNRPSDDSSESRKERRCSDNPHQPSHTFPQKQTFVPPCHTAASLHLDGPINTVSEGNKIGSNASSSYHTQFGLESVEIDTTTGLSATAPDRSRPGGKTSIPSREIPVNLSITEISKLLERMGGDADSKLKEKLETAQSRSSSVAHHHETEGKMRDDLPSIHLAAHTPIVVSHSGREMSSDATNFSSQSDLAANDDTRTEKVILRRQNAVNHHVRSISTPVPCPLTPQPQPSHKNLEPRGSNSSTDSGLSQSQRSSTVSNSSGSAFLSDEEEKRESEDEDREHDELTQSISLAAAPALPQHLRRKDQASSMDCHTAKRRQGQEAKDVDKIKRHSAGHQRRVAAIVNDGDSRVKQKPTRRQSESTKDTMVDKREKMEKKRAPHSLSGKRNRAISLPELSPLNPASKTGLTIEWRIPRDDFIDPIFHHRNKCFDKRCRFSTGSGSSTLNVHLAIKLYPNGINWDQGSYSTLKVEIVDTSRPPSCTAYILFDVSGYDCYAGHVIASRQVEYPLRSKEFLIPEFLSHDVIKVSHAKNLEFRATIKVKYLLCSDWVVIPAE